MISNISRLHAVLIGLPFVLILVACDSNQAIETDHSQTSDLKPARSANPNHESLDNVIRQIDPVRIIRTIEQAPQQFPSDWMNVKSVDAKSIAGRIGLQPGDRMIERAGIPMNRFYSRSGDGDLVWLDAESHIKKHHLPAGPFGTSFKNQRDFVSWYVLQGNRNPAWDADVVTALALHERAPGLAADFWRKASDKGYPDDPLSNLCRMVLACNLGDPVRAAAHADAFGSMARAPAGLPCWESDWQAVSATTGNPKWMADISEYLYKEYPENMWVQQHCDLADMQMLAWKRSNPGATHPPSELAAKMRRTSILANLENSARWPRGDNSITSDLQTLCAKALNSSKNGSMDFEPQTLTQMRDTSSAEWFGPKTKSRDMDLTIQFGVSPLDPESSGKYVRDFHIGFANRENQDDSNTVRNPGQVPWAARICTIAFTFNNTPSLGFSSINAVVASRLPQTKMLLRSDPYRIGNMTTHGDLPDHRPKPGTQQKLRVIRVGNQVEAILDGKRIILAHVPSHIDDTGVFFFLSGVEVKITGFQLDALD